SAHNGRKLDQRSKKRTGLGSHPAQSQSAKKGLEQREMLSSMSGVLDSGTTRQSRVSSSARTPHAGSASSRHSLTASPTNFSTASRINRAPSFGRNPFRTRNGNTVESSFSV